MKHSTLASLMAQCLVPVRAGEGLELSYASVDDVPAGYENLYTEKDGKYVLTGINGIKTSADVDRLQTALNKERTEHKATKEKINSLSSYGSIDEIVQRLDAYPELEAKASGKGDPDNLEKIVQARLSPLQRQLKQYEEQQAILAKENENYKAERVRNTIRDEVVKAATALKVKSSAIEDAVLYAERVLTVDETGNVVTRDNVGVTPFLDPKSWLTEMLPNKPHWMEDSFGGGSHGNRGTDFASNPFSPDNWNITEQMKIYRESPEKAKQMAKRYGVDPTNPQKPAKKS